MGGRGRPSSTPAAAAAVPSPRNDIGASHSVEFRWNFIFAFYRGGARDIRASLHFSARLRARRRHGGRLLRPVLCGACLFGARATRGAEARARVLPSPRVPASPARAARTSRTRGRVHRRGTNPRARRTHGHGPHPGPHPGRRRLRRLSRSASRLFSRRRRTETRRVIRASSATSSWSSSFARTASSGTRTTPTTSTTR